MRVLVTGASGFVGAAVCRRLDEAGHEVLALVRRPGSEPPGTTAVGADLTDGDALTAAVGGAAPAAVVHLAAEIASQRDPARIAAVNVEGTRRLVAARGGRPRGGRRGLPLRRRHPDHVLRLHGADRARARPRPAAPDPGAPGAGRRRRRHRDRRGAQRPVVDAKLKARLGWSPRYPSAAEGVPAALAALGMRR